MKILNVSMIALALATAGASTAFAQGGDHLAIRDAAVTDTYAARTQSYTDANELPASANLDQQSAATLNLHVDSERNNAN